MTDVDAERTREDLNEVYYGGILAYERYFWFEVPLEGVEGHQYTLSEQDVLSIYSAMIEFVEMGGVIADEDFNRFIDIATVYWHTQMYKLLRGEECEYAQDFVRQQLDALTAVQQGEPFSIAWYCQMNINRHEDAIADAVRVRNQDAIDVVWDRAYGWRNQMLELGFIPESRYGEKKPRFRPTRR